MGEKLKNKEIKANKIMLVDLDGKKIGEKNIQEALVLAEEKGVDIVQMDNGDIPVCKLMSYVKDKYLKNKKQKQMKKTVKQQKLKEVRFNLDTALHDIAIKANHITKFIEEGHKVKISMKLTSRMTFPESYIESKIYEISGMIKSPYKIDGNINKNNNFWSIQVVPAKK